MTYDYQIQREEDDPPCIEEVFACRCGFPQCRGTMLWPPDPPKRPKRKPKRKPAATKRTRQARNGGREAANTGRRGRNSKQARGTARKSSRRR